MKYTNFAKLSNWIAKALTCEFTNTDDEIRSQIIQRCSSKNLRENALRDDNMTLAKLIEHARALENSTKQALDMEKGMDNSTQELATLRINEDENRRNRRNESHNTTRHDTRSRSSFDNKSPEFSRQTTLIAESTTTGPCRSAITVATLGRMLMHLVQQEGNSAIIVIV